MTASITTAAITLDGINGFAQQVETTSINVANTYQTDVTTINTLLQAGITTAAQQKQLETAINSLKNLLTNGINDPTYNQTFYMTQTMANELEPLFQSLSLVNVNVTSPKIQFSTLADATNWSDTVNSSQILQPLITYATNGTSLNSSFQSLIELDYVKTGNDLMSTQLGNLQTALSATQSALNQLGSLQDLHNEITISSLGSFSSFFPLDQTDFATPTAYMSAYNKAASTFFGNNINPTSPLFPTGPNWQYANIPANFYGITPSNAAAIGINNLNAAQNQTLLQNVGTLGKR